MRVSGNNPQMALKKIMMMLKVTVCTVTVIKSEFYWTIMVAKTLHDRGALPPPHTITKDNRMKQKQFKSRLIAVICNSP